MSTYAFPEIAQPQKVPQKTVYMVPSGDQRESANLASWPVQKEFEETLTGIFASKGWKTIRAFDQGDAKHGFIDSQKLGMKVFQNIPQDAPLVVAIANWQYSSHVLPGLRTHQGPVLTVANFSPSWPGLVGLLGLNAGLTKMGKPYSTLWTIDGSDQWFLDKLEAWLEHGSITHDASHVKPYEPSDSEETRLGQALAKELVHKKALLGLFDEGCMGMYNAIIDDELMNPLGIFKERMSQSELWAQMQKVDDDEAMEIHQWLLDQGMTFRIGEDEESELTMQQLMWQYKMYICLVRMTKEYGFDAVGVQYQQGLKNVCPASDLVEGLLNNASRPPVFAKDGSGEIQAGKPIPNFNEVDEGVAVDALMTNRIWTAMGMDPATTLHDVRWGEQFGDDYVWALEISGSVPASHLPDGYKSAEGWRQGPVFFPAGGATLNGVCKKGEIVWSRIYIKDNSLHADIGLGKVIELPKEESDRRKQLTNPEWPIAHAVFYGITRDQFMARHKANHIQLVYADDKDSARRARDVKAAMFDELGITVHLCGTTE
ncbi:MAG: hypothetical protein Q4P66_00140 [Actinomycetaceae bacterium]|nr:hypothetical protein [Actinomycetaceae bacterium]